ncbi:MAG: dynamin family protein [Myxococcota bacterium]
MGFLDRVGRFIDDVLLLPDDVRQDVEAGEAAIAAELFSEAESLFLGVLRERPQLARAAVGLAQARQGLGDSPGTLEALKEARLLVPEDGDLAAWTARLALSEGDYALAARAATDAARARAADGGPPLAEACALTAWAEWRQGRPDRAARELRKALSADPDRTDLQVALVEALADARDAGGARAAAARLTASELDAASAARVGQALARSGSGADARVFLEVAAATGEPSAQIALAQEALVRGSIDEAERLAREAVARGVGAQALAVLGDALAARNAYADAAEAYAAAAAIGNDLELWRQAARVAPRETALVHVEALAKASPSDEVAVAIRAWVEERAAEGTEPRALLATAAVRLREGDAAGAVAALDAFAETRSTRDREEAEALRRTALRALWSQRGELDLAGAIDAVARFGEAHDLVEVARRAHALRDELDRPLLLAVLGEFNAGKSTLINAFIGVDVAPMGIVPTTATLNVLRGGAERLVRVVYREGSTREGTYDALRGMLEEVEALGSDAAGAESVDRVEIVFPSEILERVWILDAPGTNALDAEHERLAQEAARRADAVLWVFDAAQAGKQTETRIHRGLREQGRRVVAVLNKTDRLKDGERERVVSVVRESFGEEPVCISAKAALKAQLAENSEAYDASGFPSLLAVLEERVFSKSRQLKRSACAGRLAAELDAALATEETLRQERDVTAEGLKAVQDALVRKASDLRLAVDDAMRALARDLDAAFDAGADEVLAFVRPRASTFASHGVHPEDRAFLAQMLEVRLRSALDACEKRLVARVRGLLEHEGNELTTLDSRVRGAIRPSLAAFWGFQRGVLAGGALRQFFEQVLPRADLEKEVLASALSRARVDPQNELRDPLLESLGDLHRGEVARVDADLARLAEEGERSEAQVFGPMRVLRQVLGEAAGTTTIATSLVPTGRVD